MRLHYLRFLLFVFCLLLTLTSPAQDGNTAPAPWSGFTIEANPFAGKVYKHESKFTLPLPSLSTGLDMEFELHTYGKKSWEQRRHYPTLGISVDYTNYGILSVYGRLVGVTPNVILPIVNGKRLQWTVRLGDGVGYVTRHFSRVPPVDTTNVAIGSGIDDFAFFSTDLRFYINPHWGMQLGAQFTHISDASFDKPNLGINFYGAHIGLSYSPVTSRPAHIRHVSQPLKNRFLFQMRLSMAYVSSEAPDGPLYPVYIASAYVSRRWHNMNKMFLGYDYSFNSDIDAFLKNNQIFPGDEAQHSWRSAVFFGNEFMIGHVGVILQVGIYTHQAALVLAPFYEKIGGHYYLIQKEHGPLKELFLSAMLKTHLTIAELGEFGIGCGF